VYATVLTGDLWPLHSFRMGADHLTDQVRLEDWDFQPHSLISGSGKGLKLSLLLIANDLISHAYIMKH
jgi:hypothetical protein